MADLQLHEEMIVAVQRYLPRDTAEGCCLGDAATVFTALSERTAKLMKLS